MGKTRDLAEYPNQGVTLTETQTLSNKTLNSPVVSGNMTTDGLIDGRDVASDGLKLDGIETGATADQIASEVPYSNATSGLAATDVQGAVDELESEKQPLDATLTALAGVLTAAGKIPYATGLDTAGELDFLDEDTLASNSATGLPSQQSVKTYVDTSISAAAPDQISPITASVASNALTIAINPTTIDFRDSSLSSGVVDTIIIPSQISMTVSSGSTLGTSNGVAARLVILAINNAGTVEVAISNLAGGVNLDETTLISTTAEGGAGGADSASVIYSTTSRSNVPFRVVGFIDITEATAGTWATAPTTIQGAGGNAITAMQSIGYGQTWQDVTGSRISGLAYANSTGRPIMVYIGLDPGTADDDAIQVSVDASTWVGVGAESGAAFQPNQFIVPAGQFYRVNGATISRWSELR